MNFLIFFLITCLYASDNITLTRTFHTLTIEEETMPYTAITGEFPIENSDGEETAEVFFIAYIKDQEDSARPITFVFPGGPGGSCALEVICSVGPRRLLTPNEGKSLLPPYRLIDNPESIFPWTDLVFIDPPGTGYSSLLDGDENEEENPLLSVEGDIEALGQFVRTFIAYFDRWNSPKYLSGISYGTTRCAGLAEGLRDYDISLHGLILMGSAMDFSLLLSQQNHFLPNCLMIPTFAATAWYHGRFWPDRSLKEVVDFARSFVFDTFVPAMLQPTRLNPFERETFYKQLSELIGLPIDTVRRYQGRLDEHLFKTEFFAAERKILGGLDTRIVGDLSMTQPYFDFDDPSSRDMQGILCAFCDYLQRELDTKRPLDRYFGFSHQHFYLDTYDSYSLPDLFQRLRRTLVHNPHMKVFIGSGYYDCCTPFAASEYLLDHLDLPPSYQKNFQFEYYEAGHGIIFDYPSLKKLKKDLSRFYVQ